MNWQVRLYQAFAIASVVAAVTIVSVIALVVWTLLVDRKHEAEIVSVDVGEALELRSLFDAAEPICIFGDQEFLDPVSTALPYCNAGVMYEAGYGNTFYGMRAGTCRKVSIASEPGRGLRPDIGCARYGPNESLRIVRTRDGRLIWQD